MKKAIVLGAAMLLAGAAAFAADVKFSGKFRAGYTFTFEDGDMVSTPKYFDFANKKYEGRLNFVVSDADGLWSLSIKSLSGSLDSNDKLATKATVNVGKALEKNGLDLNGFGLKFAVGNMKNNALLKAYDNASGDDRDAFKLFASGDKGYITSFTASYDKLTFQVDVDPVSNGEKAAGYAFSAKYADNDLGFAVAAGYAHNNAAFTDDGDNDCKDGFKLSEQKLDNGFVVSGNVDIAKLAGLDFKLGAGAVFGYVTEEDVGKGMRVAADLSGGIDAIDGWIEYQYDVVDPDNADKLSNHYLKANANFNFFADKGIGLDAYCGASDLENASDYWFFGGDIGYKLGGAAYNLNVEVANNAATDNVKVAVTPKVTIAW